MTTPFLGFGPATVGRQPVVIIGVGNSMRHDDGVGPAAIAALMEAEAGSGVELLACTGEPARLIDAWQDRRLAVVIDAVASGETPGTIERVEVDDETVRPGSAITSHGPGLCEAWHLAVVLDRAPDRLVVYGVQPADLGHGRELSPAVARAVPALVGQISTELRHEIGTGGAERRSHGLPVNHSL